MVGGGGRRTEGWKWEEKGIQELSRESHQVMQSYEFIPPSSLGRNVVLQDHIKLK